MTVTHCHHCGKLLAQPVKLPGAPLVAHLACAMKAAAATRALVALVNNKK